MIDLRLLGLTAVAGCALVVATSLPAQTRAQATPVSYYTRGSELVLSAPAPAVAVRAEPPVAAVRPVAATEYDRQGLVVVRPPSIDVATIRKVLQQAGSPAAADAQAIFDLGERYGLDPAICLAFFIVESSAGTKGMATETRSLGNIRATPGYINHKGYRKYATWEEGIEDWYRLISRLYIGEWNLMTVESIVPVYAPSDDGNEPAAYVATVRQLVRDWRTGRV